MHFSWFITASTFCNYILRRAPTVQALSFFHKHTSKSFISTRKLILRMSSSGGTNTADTSFEKIPSKPSNLSSSSSSSFQIVQFSCLEDNYGYLLHDESTGETAAIDTPESKVYKEELEKRNWTLTHIFNTHHHWDHVGGNMDLKSNQVKIYGPMIEKEKIPGIDIPICGGDTIDFGRSKAQIIDVGGHTKGHIAYYFPQENVVFVGDSLFSLGCGRMFEGTPYQFWESLNRLRSLPEDTWIYCAHEYTASNAKFAKSVEPNNQDLIHRVEQVIQLRESQLPTIPCRLGDEKKTNPFLRVDISPEIRRNILIQENEDDAIAFYKLRLAKDKF